MAILCKEINLLFICVPKTGSSSLEHFLISNFAGKQVLKDHIWDDDHKNILVDYKHIKIKEIISHRLLTLAQLEQMKTLVVTRNPFDWVVSSYVFNMNLYQRLKQEGEKAPDWITARKHSITKIASMSFDEYVAHEFNNQYLSVYSSFIEGIDETKVEVVKLEQLDIEVKRIFQELGVELFQNIPHYNKTEGKKTDFRRYYSNKSRRIIEQSFARDFERLGYSFDDIQMFKVIKKIINFSNKFENKIFGYNIESPNLEYSTNVAKVFLSGWVLPREGKEAQIVVEGSSIMETFLCNIQRDDVSKTILGEINPNIKCGFEIVWIHTGVFNISFLIEGEKMLVAEIEITSCREIENEIQQWKKTIISYQQVLEINADAPNLNSDIAEAYYQLGKIYIEQNQLEESALCYQKVLEKQPYQKLTGYNLQEMIAIAKGFYELGLQNAETSKLSEGIKCFENVSMMQTKGNIYNLIWRGLNSPGVLDINDLSIKEDLANRINRISKSSYKRCSQEFLQQIEIVKQNFPLVCFQIRTHIPFWLSQVEGIANIINQLSKDYPNLGVVFDGWSRTEIDRSEDNDMIARENREVTKIINRLDIRTKVYNAIGCKTYEKVVWAQTIDTYIAPCGSGLTFLSTIANKTGIVHGDSKFYHNRIKLDLSISRENGIPPLLVPGYSLEGDMTPAIHRNYECDWLAIYDEVVKIIQSLLQTEK